MRTMTHTVRIDIMGLLLGDRIEFSVISLGPWLVMMCIIYYIIWFSL